MSNSFQVTKMRRHEDGFFVAVVHSNVNQEDYTVHDRWGSWMISNPDERKFTGASEPQRFGISPGYLQDYRKRHEKKMKVWVTPHKDRPGANIFVKKAKAKDNPMVKKKPKDNPMLAAVKKTNLMLAKKDEKRREKNNPMLAVAKKNPMAARSKTKTNPMLVKKRKK